MLRATRRIGVPAVQALASYWGTAAVVAATGAAALAAVLPVASLVRGGTAGLAPRLGLALFRALEPAGAWIAPESPAAIQNQAVAVLFQLLLGTALARLAVAALTLLGLFTAGASQRAPEIAVRRAVGASRWGLVGSTLLEALALAAVALIIGGGVGALGARLALATWPGVTAAGSIATSAAVAAATAIAICIGAILPAALAPGRRIAETPSVTASVLRRRPRLQPPAEVVRFDGELPFSQQRQRHRAHRAARRDLERAREQPRLEAIRCGILAHCSLEQLALDREPDPIRGGVPLAAPAPALRGVERGQQAAANRRGSKLGRRLAHDGGFARRPGRGSIRSWSA